MNDPGPDGCSIGSATEFLGGTAGIDVLVPEVQVETIGETCVLTVPMEAVAGTAAGVLDTDQDAAWRACTNAHAGKLVVPCSEPHTGEFVGWDLSSGSTPLERCNTAAATYLGADPGPLDDRIRVTIEPDADTPTPCLLSTTRTNLGIPVVLRNLSDWGFTVTSLD
ncbi:hypothetical protein ACF3NT_05375 [Naumannella halotolerans]|uniref:hypothetical protein n=1 Tax=Naumannella halotolerans TaxID=993414 RepID=UPI0010607B30|nr:hypothetical protein [Naumannella halotolerans]